MTENLDIKLISEKKYEEHFGNELILLKSRSFWLRLSTDRGVFGAEISSVNDNRWFSYMVANIYLEGKCKPNSNILSEELFENSIKKNYKQLEIIFGTEYKISKPELIEIEHKRAMKIFPGIFTKSQLDQIENDFDT